MNIKEIEERSGLTRANIRYYEQEGLIAPARRENKYRDYSEEDLETLLRVALLRSLGFSLDEIRRLQSGELELAAAMRERSAALESEGQRLLAARNAHKALLYAAALLDFDIRWLWPAPDAAGALCTCPVEPEALACALDGLTAEGRTPFGVYLTSPDYLGFVQDIAGLAAVCHAHGVPLLVDNAHGAYLHFLKEGSRHPIQLGADLCCDSAHKTLPVLTGGAYLHLGPSVQADEAAVRNALALFGSTSPSYLILQSLDAANARLAGDFREKLALCRWRLGMLCRELDAFRPGLALPLTGAHREPLKLTLDAAVLGLSGQQLAQALREQGVECEYADPRYLVLMPSPESSAEDFARLQKALHALCAEASSAAPASDSDAAAFAALAEALQAQPRSAAIREAVLAPQEMVPAAEAVGRICAAPAVSCPPAVPIVVSGEVIPAQALPLFARYGIGRVAVVKD